MKNICIISGTRADYGLLKPLMKLFYSDDYFNPILFITGSHMEEQYGYTYKLIEKDNFKINEKIHMKLHKDFPCDILCSMACELRELALLLTKYTIDLIIILGDRYEMLVAAQAALIYNIPIAHLFGGDVTLGAYDNSIRNAITQMAKYHFVSCESSKNNLIKMNVNPNNIFVIGNPGLYELTSFIPIDKIILYNNLNITKNKYMVMVVYHPETLLDQSKNIRNTDILFDALVNIKDFAETNLLFIHSNADNFNNHIFEKINILSDKYSNIYSYSSLERDIYLNLLHYCDLFIGNSSSGIYEVPFFKKITLNIGNRQKGRERGNSVINLDFDKLIITNKINSILDNTFKIGKITTPYKSINSSQEIASIIKNNFKKEKKNIAIIGGGGHARVIIDALYEMQKNTLFANYNIIGFLDDNINSNKYRNIDRIGTIKDIKNINNDVFYICGIGNLNIRKKFINMLDKVNWVNVIHPSAIISRTVILEQGIFISANVVINSQAIIKEHAIINTNSIIEHDVLIGKNCHIAPSVTICGHATVNKNSFVGSGTTIINKNKYGFITIGKNNFINAGSLILHSTKDNSKIRGIY